MNLLVRMLERVSSILMNYIETSLEKPFGDVERLLGWNRLLAHLERKHLATHSETPFTSPLITLRDRLPN